IDVSGYEVLQRFFIMPNIMLVVWLLLHTKVRPQFEVLSAMLLILGLGWNLWSGFNANHLKGASWYDSRARFVLQTLPPNAIILAEGDGFWSSIFYLNQVEKIRPDIVLLSPTAVLYHQRDRWAAHLPNLFKQGEIENPSLFTSLDLSQRRLFTNATDLLNPDQWGIKYGPILNEITPKRSDNIVDCAS